MLWKTVKIVLLVIGAMFVLYWAALIAAMPLNAKTAAPTDLSTSLLKRNVPGPLQKDVDLKIVTFNVHDMYLISRHREERMLGIARTLRELDPDIVGLQEMWVEKDRELLEKALADSRLKYWKHYPSGYFGSGLVVLSAYPIVEDFFHRFVRAGKWYKPYHGDWWGAKGVALARIELPGVGYVDFYNTHTHAGYGGHEYDREREAQMNELVAFLKDSRTGTSPAFVVGDLNCCEGSKAFENVVTGAQLEWMMTGEARIDNILAARNERYDVKLIDSTKIDRKVSVGHGEARLSDHNGYMSTIHIKPK